MLKVVTGEMPKYPFDRKKVVTGAPKIGIDQSRSQSLAALKNKKVQVLQRLPPGGYKSNLAKQRQEELNKKELDEKVEREKKDIERIKRAMMLKKKIAQSHQLPRQLSVPTSASGVNREPLYKGDDFEARQVDDVLNSISVIDPSSDKKLDQKKLA